ncbi:hypothetical protein [Sphingobium chungbukense]|nr:hypothetical protein [Sphingobium chungbukense]
MSSAERAQPNINYDVTQPRCATCQFWAPDTFRLEKGTNDPSFGFGACRRRPPQIIDALARVNINPPRPGMHLDNDEVFSVDDAFDSTMFPVTFYTSWCGEFEWLPELSERA